METFVCNPKVESWVNCAPFDLQNFINNTDFSILLFERQIHYNDGILKEYTRNIINCRRNDDINFINPLQIQVNPEYEQCIFHSFFIYRDGTKIDILNTINFNEIQREVELEYKVYSGLKTYIAHIEGIHKGDIIEYSFSKNICNPIYKNNFSYIAPLQYPWPVFKFYNKMLFSHKTKNLKVRSVYKNNEENKFTITSNEPFVYEKETIPALVFEEGMTADAAFPSYIEFSTYENWKELGEDLLKDFNQNYSDIFDAQSYIQSICNIEDKEKIIETIINYVKTNIHYQSICVDEYSYIPHAPDVTIKRNFGDCKDKSLLLKVLLESIGAKCSVILVHTFHGSKINTRLVSISCFNHAIIKLFFNNEIYYIDPADEFTPFFFETPIERNYKYYYDTADMQLYEMTNVKNSIYSRSVQKYFTISYDNATLNIKDTYKYLEFPRIYSLYLTQPIATIQQNYLEYFKTYYPTIEYCDYNSFQIATSPEKGTVTIYAQFSIDNIWRESTTNKNIVHAIFYPFLLNEYITVPDIAVRKTPYIWHHPVEFNYSFEINYPQLKGKNSHELVDNEFFFISVDFKHSNNWNYDITFKSKKESIQPGSFTMLKEEVNKLKQKLGKVIGRKKYAIYKNASKNDTKKISWIVIYLAGFFLIRVLMALFFHK